MIIREPNSKLWGGEIGYIRNLPPNLTVLEIGTYRGGTTLIFAEKAKLVVTVDVFNSLRVQDPAYQDPEMQDYNIQEVHENLKRKNNIIMTVGTSEQIIPILQDNFFDFIFIDGDHTYEGCKLDGELAFSKLKEDGLIMFHDYDPASLGRPGIYKYIHEAFYVENGVLESSSIIFNKKDKK